MRLGVGAGIAGVVVAAGAIAAAVLRKKEPEVCRFDQGFVKVKAALPPEDQAELELAMDYLDDFLRECDDLEKTRQFCDVLADSVTFKIPPAEARRRMQEILSSSGIGPLRIMAGVEGCRLYAHILEKHLHGGVSA